MRNKIRAWRGRNAGPVPEKIPTADELAERLTSDEKTLDCAKFSNRYNLRTARDRQVLRKLIDRATPGPWEAIYFPHENPARESYGILTERYGDTVGLVSVEDRVTNDHPMSSIGTDAEFIATARDAMPVLLEALEEDELILRRVREALYRIESTTIPSKSSFDTSDIYLILTTLRNVLKGPPNDR